jgi:hypothetical protein
MLRLSNRFQVLADDEEGNDDNEVEGGESEQGHGGDGRVPGLNLISWRPAA